MRVCSVSSLIMPRPNRKRIRQSPFQRLRIRSGDRFSAGKPNASPTAVPSSTAAKVDRRRSCGDEFIRFSR